MLNQQPRAGARPDALRTLIAGMLAFVLAVGWAGVAQAQVTFGAKADFPTGVGPAAVAVGDFNGDGNLDYVVADNTANTVSVFLGDGLGGFGAKTDYPTGVGPAAVAVGDLNGDGKLDLMVANFTDNTVSVLLGNGLGGFGSKTDFPTGVGPSALGLADLNVDGKLDLVVANKTDGTVSILLGTGSAASARRPISPWVLIPSPSPSAISTTTHSSTSLWRTIPGIPSPFARGMG
jgi:hypothetical protein